MRKFLIVAGQVYRKNVKSGAWLSLVLTPILFLLLASGISFLIGQSAGSDTDIAVVTSEPAIVDVLNKSNADTTFKKKDKKAAEKLLRKEEVGGILTVKTVPSVSGHLVMREGALSASDTAVISSTLSGLKTSQSAGKLGLSQGDLSALLAPAKLTTKTVQINEGKVTTSGTSDAVKAGIAFMLTIFTMAIVVTYGSIVGQEIAMEKGSRVMETLLSSVSAKTQFFGKIAGMLGLLLTQLAFYLIAFVTLSGSVSQLKAAREMLGKLDLSVLWTPDVLMMLAYFVVGVLSFVVLAALCGSLVSNQEQVSSAMFPIVAFSMTGYALGFVAQAGDNMVVRIASFVPFVSSELMPVRRALGQASLAEAGVGLVIATLFLLVFGWFSSKLYETNVLVYSDNGFFKRLARSYKLRRANEKA